MNLRTQPTPTSCTQACLAMIIDAPVEDVLSVYPNPMGQFEFIKALTECDVLFNVISLGPLVFEGIYTCAVPSLNHPGTNHQLMLDVNFDHEDGHALWVFDPNSGREGAKIYDSDGSNLKSWTELIRVREGGKLPTQ